MYMRCRPVHMKCSTVQLIAVERKDLAHLSREGTPLTALASNG